MSSRTFGVEGVRLVATPPSRARDIADMCRLHVVEPSDIERALDLWSDHERLDMRDAIFAAQALNRNIDAILSPDRDFDGIPDLERIDPADTTAVASLGTASL